MHSPQPFLNPAALSQSLRLAQDTPLPVSSAATAHGQRRRAQGYSPAMVVEESRPVEVVTFGTLHLDRAELDRQHLLLDVTVIADEVDLQLGRALSCWKPRQLGRKTQSDASKRRSRCGCVRGCPVLSSHFSPGPAPHVGHWTDCTCWGVGFFDFMVADNVATCGKNLFNLEHIFRRLSRPCPPHGALLADVEDC
jgi:hypothetical protein